MHPVYSLAINAGHQLASAQSQVHIDIKSSVFMLRYFVVFVCIIRDDIMQARLAWPILMIWQLPQVCMCSSSLNSMYACTYFMHWVFSLAGADPNAAMVTSALRSSGKHPSGPRRLSLDFKLPSAHLKLHEEQPVKPKRTSNNKVWLQLHMTVLCYDSLEGAKSIDSSSPLAGP